MNFIKRYGMVSGVIAICFCVVVYVVFTTHSIFTISRQINYVAEHPYKAMSEINKIRARVLEMNTYLPIFISENENNLDGIRSVLRTSCQENEKSLKILDEIYLGNKEDLSELNGALDELKKALIQSVENSENSNMDRQAVQKYFDKEIEPIRVKTDIAIQKVIDSADRRVLIIQESTDEKQQLWRILMHRRRQCPVLLRCYIRVVISPSRVMIASWDCTHWIFLTKKLGSA